MMRSLKTLAPIALLLVAGNLLAQRSPAVRYKRYLNARFAYGVDYPDALLRPKGESDNGDGQVFASADGGATLTVWGSNNATGATLSGNYRSEIAEPGRRITYKAIKRNWFVVSGTEGDDIFYIKSIAVKGGFRTMMIRYPASQSATYNPIAAHVAGSFNATGARTE